jgi:hypothetical protein
LDEPHYLILRRTSTSQFHPLLYSGVLVFLFLILPKVVIMKITFLLRFFLWKGSDLASGNAKVAWNTIYLPKKEEGLGVKNLEVWN